jgi:hypothetical protein
VVHVLTLGLVLPVRRFTSANEMKSYDEPRFSSTLGLVLPVRRLTSANEMKNCDEFKFLPVFLPDPRFSSTDVFYRFSSGSLTGLIRV